jgi:hypothetical protein
MVDNGKKVEKIYEGGGGGCESGGERERKCMEL